MDCENRWKSLDAQLLGCVLWAVTVPASIFCRAQLFSSSESLQAIAQVQLNLVGFVGFVGIVFALLRLVLYVETEVHIRILCGGNIATAITGNCARQLAIEGLMHYAFAVFDIGVGRAAVCEVERVEDELHILVCVLLLVACERLSMY
jgi:hypothetical protein